MAHAYLKTSIPAFPKPSQVKREIRIVHVFPGGREVCNRQTAADRAEYKRRTEAMWVRQRGRCCLEGFIEGCPGQLILSESTFDHEDGRGMGGAKRDDRIWKDGKPYNGAAHMKCNTIKGSRFIDYNHRGIR